MRYITKEMLLALTVFSKEFTGVHVGESKVNMLQLAVAAYGMLVFFEFKRLWGLVATLAGVVVLSIGLFSVYDYPISAMFIRQVLAVSFIYVGIGAFLLRCSSDKLISAYIYVCTFAALFGLLQFVLSAVGVPREYLLLNIPLRVDSFAGEPSHYAVAVAPAVYYCFRYWKHPRVMKQGVIIVTSVVLTVSTTAVAVIAVAFALAFLKRRGIAAVLVATVCFPFILVIPADLFPEVIATRIVDTIEYVSEGTDSWDTKNLTVLSFSTNFDVMRQTMLSGRILGNGFCGHATAYYRHFDHTGFSQHTWYGINSSSAHCLVIRIVSEFGILGAIFLGGTIWRFVTNQRADVWSMFFVMAMMARMFKLGSWIDYGLPILVLAVIFVGAGLKSSDPPRDESSCSDSRRRRSLAKDTVLAGR